MTINNRTDYNEIEVVRAPKWNEVRLLCDWWGEAKRNWYTEKIKRSKTTSKIHIYTYLFCLSFGNRKLVFDIRTESTKRNVNANISLIFISFEFLFMISLRRAATTVFQSPYIQYSRRIWLVAAVQQRVVFILLSIISISVIGFAPGRIVGTHHTYAVCWPIS